MSTIPLRRMGASGQCLEQPAEPEGSGFNDKIKLRSYATQEISGLVFGYLGPEPVPLLPLYDVLRWDDGVKGIQLRNIDANWLNHVEKIVDVSHLAWLHGHSFPAMVPRRSLTTGTGAITARTM